MDHLELRFKITSDNLSSGDIRDSLYQMFGYNSILSHEEQLKKERPELAESSVRLRNGRTIESWTFAESRIHWFQKDLLSRLKGTKAEKLIYLTQKLRYYPQFNEQPRALLDVLTPEFFKIFPQGEIWFIELSKTTRDKIWDEESKLQKVYNTDSLGSPHGMSGLEGGLSIYHWLTLMMYCFYPFVNGAISTPDARLIFLLLPDKAINSLREYRFDLYRATEFDCMDIYSDSINPLAGRGIKSRFPEDSVDLSNTRCYFEWYIQRCSILLDELLAIQDLKKRFLATLTLNRLAVDIRIIETSELPYLMKLLFFGVLDKLANLCALLGIESQETEIWKRFLTKDFYELELKGALLGIPGRIGEIMCHNAEWIFEHLEIYGPSPEVIRELRNSYHGYGLRRIETLLSHSGELHNDVPSLSNILWHWLLAKGLPRACPGLRPDGKSMREAET